MKIVILDADTLGKDIDLSIFDALGETVIYNMTAPKEVAERIKGADAVIINKVKLNEENLENSGIKLICIAATGYDNVDTAYCKEAGIAVTNVVGYSSNSVAQVTASMVLSLATHIPEYNRAVESGSYTKSGVQNCLTPVYHELAGKVWGIVGYGNIGKNVGKIAEALGCRVVVCKRAPVDTAECVDIDTLCKISDIISVHTPLSEQTRELINRERIELMKETAIVVNVARGAVVDETALCNAVKNKKIGGIGVDVYSVEPMEETSPYAEVMHMDNVCLTPHMAWGAYEARVRCLNEIKLNIEAFLRGEKRCRV